MAEDQDPFAEFGGKVITKKTTDTDPFAEFGGKTLKKKVSSEPVNTTTTPSASGSDDIAYEVNLPEEVNINAQAVNPLAGGYSLQDQIPVARQNELVQEVNADVEAQNELSNRLSKINQAYGSPKDKGIQKARNSAIQEQPQLVQGVEDSERDGNRATYLYNKVLEGVGSVVAGLGDLAVQGSSIIGTGQLDANPITRKMYRESIAPNIRTYLKETVGANVDKGLEAKYNNETITSALGGLASSAPAIAATVASGGVGTGAMFLQSYDGALQSINQTEAGQNLDEATKTLFAGGVGLVTSALEKYGLDKIFKGETGVISNMIAKNALKNATKETGGKVTGDILTKLLDKEVVDLTNKYIKGGIKALDGALIEYGTEGLQEASQAGAELLTNAVTGKPVFDTTETSTWDGFLSRVHKAGVAGAIGGGLLGTVASLGGIKTSDLDKTTTQLNEVNTALQNEELSDSARQILVEQKVKLQGEYDKATEKIDKAYDKLSDKQKDEVNGIIEDKVKVEEAIADPNIPESVKEGLKEQSKELDNQISEIKPIETEDTLSWKKVTDAGIAEETQMLEEETSQTKVGRFIDKLLKGAPDDTYLKELKANRELIDKDPIKFFENKIDQARNLLKEDPTQSELYNNSIKNLEYAIDEIKTIQQQESQKEVTTPKQEETPLETIKTPSNETNEQPVSETKNVEEVSTFKTEETSTKAGEESVKTEKPKFTIKGETVIPKENVSDNKQPTVKGEVKADAEFIQPTKDDGGRNEPKAERVGTAEEKVKSLDRLAHQNIESEDLNNTASNQAREKGREFTDEERQYNVQKKMDALRHGDDIVVEAKNAFGDEYVSGLLKYIDDNGKTLTADKKQLMYVTLENDLNRQLLADPENLTLKKQEKLVADKSRAFGRETGRAVAMGQLRQLARVGYDATQVTEDFFSPKEIAERRKVEKAVQATPDDINKEYETREESRTDAEIEKAIESGVQKRIDEIYEALPSNRKQRADKAISALERIQKKLRSRTYDASIGLPVALLDMGLTTIKQAIKTGVKVADAIELGINKIKEKYGKEWKNEDKFRKDMLEGFSEEKIDVEEGSSNTKTDPTVKQALIDAGYSREMTIKNKDGVKEKRSILDWRKLTGEEGSLDNINKVIDQTLGDKGYTSEEIANIKQSLKDEYNDLHASIIEKATADLERRNTPRDNSSKILARRLAELYNQGLFDKDTDTYDRLINQTLGVSIKDQAMFDEIKGLHKSLADLVDSRDASGKKLSDVALSTAEAKIKNDIKKVIQKVAFSSGNGAYKATVIIKNLVNGMQRQMLNTIGQLVENPISAKYNDLQVQVQDAFKKGQWDTPELKAQRRMLSKAAYKSVLIDRGEEYGGVGSPFTTKNAFDDAIRSVAPSKLYQAYVSAVTGTAFLDSSDSAFKIKRTELEFTHNLIRVLTDKSNPNGAMSQQEALNYVSENLTGQSFADAKKTAKEIIESVNKKAGKEILSPSDTNVIRMANDIVKDALVKGEKITKDLVEDSFKAAYTTAGTGLGHESNNIITKGLGALNRSVETELNDAIKRKEFNKAAMLNMASILTKNVLNPFAGGGANWTIIGMQKMGLPTQWLDPKSFENKRLDLSSVEGLKDAQRALTARANLQRANGRTLIAGTTGLIIAAAAYGSGTDDDIKKWRKKHPVLDKYLNKVIPPALALLTNPDQSTKGKVKAVASIIGDRTGGYGDKERLYAIGKDLATNKNKQAAGRTGDLVGSRFSVPYSPIGSSQMSYQVRDLYREFMGLPPIKSNFKNKDGFTKGFFKRGWFDFLGGNDKVKKENK